MYTNIFTMGLQFFMDSPTTTKTKQKQKQQLWIQGVRLRGRPHIYCSNLSGPNQGLENTAGGLLVHVRLYIVFTKYLPNTGIKYCK